MPKQMGKSPMIINLIEALDRATEARIKQLPHPNNRASEAGHPCKRFLVAVRIRPEKYELHDIRLQRIFDEGHVQEKAVMADLIESGFEIVEQQRPYEWRKFQLSGHIDGKINVNGRLVPIEIKSCSDSMFKHIKGLQPADFLTSKFHWIRKYPAQIQLYMIMDNEEDAIFIFKNKQTGEKLQKDFALDYSYTEEILKKLEDVNDFVKKDALPPVEMTEECKVCGFQKTLCFSDQDYGPGFAFYSDERVLEMLNRWWELRPGHLEYANLDISLKNHFRGYNVVIGDFKIETKKTGSKTIVSIEKI